MMTIIEITYIARSGLKQLKEEYPTNKGYVLTVKTIELNWVEVTICKAS